MSNPQFEFGISVHDVFALAKLDGPTLERLGPVLHALHERDKQLEDFVNQVMRRYTTVEVLGNGTAHTSGSPVAVSPAVRCGFTKALKRSHLTVTCATVGRYRNASGFALFSARLLDGAGADLDDIELARLPFGPGQEGFPMLAAGAGTLGAGVSGQVSVELRVAVSAGVEWDSDASGLNVLTVAESM